MDEGGILCLWSGGAGGVSGLGVGLEGRLLGGEEGGRDFENTKIAQNS